MAELFSIDERALVDLEPDTVFGPEVDVREEGSLGNHRVIGLAFEKWRDGRAYSSASILREMGFTGDIRAIGDVTLDQLIALKRCGFSSVASVRGIDKAAGEEVLNRFPAVYQKATDGRSPAWALRLEKAKKAAE